MLNGRSNGKRNSRGQNRIRTEKAGASCQNGAPALFAFMGLVSFFVGLSAWRSAVSSRRCGNGWFRSGRRKAIIRTHLPQGRSGSDYIGLVQENGDEPIGTISVVEQNDDLNLVHIGYCIGSKWWHQGITSEAFAAIIPFLFKQVKVNRIEARHDPNNPNSGNVMKKCGLTYEGTLRQADRNNQGIVDVAIYSILAKEYGNR